jgi:hypothetical protein
LPPVLIQILLQYFQTHVDSPIPDTEYLPSSPLDVDSQHTESNVCTPAITSSRVVADSCFS